ncbi:hypothetical protein PULV_b0075 [Pseudoalteromonas ulvae UL12]|uniref:hypothetical protein n=1 Tax=Pseudoalteromonas ulvae TaxID=107327 RepID=UPI00186BA004|nr:hypothetical protein [Pseudoalteromonas ulvae]MBE0365494.1 hypothetical protein [Pseudoalteromonas ulvae UL12]
MIHEKDIDLYLKAKRQLKIRRNILIMCILMLIIWIALRLFGINNTTLDIVAVSIFMGGLVNADGGSFVPKSKLLEIIERQINSDPEAIKYVGSKTLQ